MADRYTVDDDRSRTVIIETRSGGGSTGLMVGLIIIIALVAAVAFFLFDQSRDDQARTDAVVGASQSVGDASKEVGKAIKNAADRAVPDTSKRP